MYTNIDECEAAGLDPDKVERIAKRIAAAMKDANDLGLYAYGGSCSLNLRFSDDPYKGALVVADNLGMNCDGGCGASCPDDDGLLRGEN